MKEIFESDAEKVFSKKLFELCIDHKAYGLPMDLAEEVEYLVWSYCVTCIECCSPIEKLLGAGLVFANDGRDRLRWYSTEYQKSNIDLRFLREKASVKRSVIAPQVRVGNYRVDFLIATRLPSNDVVVTAVECDGHDFHERTKDQASRDKKRDRELAAQGITTLRFTGPDIYHRLDECIEEIQDYLAGKVFMRETAA